MMHPRLQIFGAARSLLIRTSAQPARFISVSRRGYADKGPNEDVLGHVSEEASEMGKITGEPKPDLDQGIPAKEIFKRDEEAKEKAPNVVEEELGKKASFSSMDNALAVTQLELIARGGAMEAMPELPIPRDANLKYRYDPVVSQITRLMMRHGKLSKAQRNMSYILNYLRTAPAPQGNASRPLIPGAPPMADLPLDPARYINVAIDSVAPMVKIKSLRGLAGGGAALMMPVPLGLRQRRRTAFQWILEAVNKKVSRGSGKYQFAQKVADEIISVMEGKSAAWEKRIQVHRLATSNRANVLFQKGKRRR